MSQVKSFCGPRPKVTLAPTEREIMLFGDFLDSGDRMLLEGIAGFDLMICDTYVH